MLKCNERSPKEMGVITKSKDLMEHTFKKTANTKYFPKKYRFSLASKIENLSIDIYENLVKANECNLKDEKERIKRLECQQNAIVSCKILNSMIDLAKKIKSTELTLKEVEYWSGLVIEVKRMAAAWRNSDKQQNIA